jgi:hypothetical protein
MSGRGELRLDGNEAYKRAWNSDLDFEVLDVKWDGTVKKVCLEFLSGAVVRDFFEMGYYGPGPWSITDFNAEEMYEHWLTVVAEGNGTSKSRKRRHLSALLRSVMAKAQSKRSKKKRANISRNIT